MRACPPRSRTRNGPRTPGGPLALDEDFAWPPTLADLKVDRGIDVDDGRDDAKLGQVLAAAIAFIKDVHAETYLFADESGSVLPPADVTLGLGTVRLAYRWHDRRRSPDAMVSMGELGAGRVSSFDSDIDRMCRIGRFAPPVFA